MRIIVIFLISVLIFACNNQANNKEQKTDSTSVDTIVANNPKPEPVDTVFTGLGNEPFWAVYVIKNDRIVFHPMEGGDIEVPYQAAFTQDSLTQKYASAAAGSEIVLIITKKPCSDGMSDITHPYAIDLTVNKTHYTGCGEDK